MAGGKRRLKIAMVGTRGVPAAYSGIERVVEELGERIAAAGHEVTVFCMGGRYAKRLPQFRGIQLRYLPSISGKHAEMLVHAAMSSAAAAWGRFDVVHFHACGPSLFTWLPRLAGKPTVATLHGQCWRHEKWSRAASLILRVGEWSACRLASKAICVSLTGKLDLRRRLGVDVEYVSNGVDRQQRHDLQEAQSWGVSPGNYVLFVGRLTAVKNIAQLVEAFRGLDTDCKLVIAGGPSGNPDYVERLHILAAGDPRIIFTGQVYGRTLAQLYSNAALFCLPSTSEGMSMALLEAMAYGTPVLVSALPENLEVITDEDGPCGLTFPAGCALELRKGLARALASPEKLADFARRGRAITETRYSWDHAVKEMIRIYLDLVDLHPAEDQPH